MSKKLPPNIHRNSWWPIKTANVIFFIYFMSRRLINSKPANPSHRHRTSSSPIHYVRQRCRYTTPTPMLHHNNAVSLLFATPTSCVSLSLLYTKSLHWRLPVLISSESAAMMCLSIFKFIVWTLTNALFCSFSCLAGPAPPPMPHTICSCIKWGCC